LIEAMHRKSRYPNITVLILGIAVSLFNLKTILSPMTGLSLFNQLPLLLKIIPLILTVGGIVIWFLPKISIKTKTFIKITIWVLFFVYLVENLVLPIINSYLSVKDLQKIPDRSHFLDSMIYIVIRYWPDFLRGLAVTLRLSLSGTLIGLLLGLILVFFRTITIKEHDSELMAFIKKVGLASSKIYVNIFRGTPMMVQAVIIYYLVPVALAAVLKTPQAEIDKLFTLMTAGLVVVSLNTAAYLTEVLRGGIASVDKGQLEAARSLGMSYGQSMRYVVFPQGIRNALPSICNEFLINIKDTSVLNVIGVAELFFVAQDAKYRYFRTYEPFIIAAVIYLVVTLSTSKIIQKIEKKMNLEAKELPSCN